MRIIVTDDRYQSYLDFVQWFKHSSLWLHIGFVAIKILQCLPCQNSLQHCVILVNMTGGWFSSFTYHRIIKQMVNNCILNPELCLMTFFSRECHNQTSQPSSGTKRNSGKTWNRSAGDKIFSLCALYTSKFRYSVYRDFGCVHTFSFSW